MTFQFRPCANPEIAAVAYELPPVPFGTSHGLRMLINAYAEAIRDGTDGSEDQPYAAVSGCKAGSLSDVIAKLQIQLHYDYRGLDDSRLVLALTEPEQPTVLRAQALLAELYAQLPQNWDSALRAYRAAVLAEHDYDRRIWRPGYEAGEKGDKGNPPEVEEEMERLQDIRFNAEAFLMDMPAPSLAEFAVKYLICFDGDRDLNGNHEGICAEAKRLLHIDSDPGAGELAIILASLNGRAA